MSFQRIFLTGFIIFLTACSSLKESRTPSSEPNLILTRELIQEQSEDGVYTGGKYFSCSSAILQASGGSNLSSTDEGMMFHRNCLAKVHVSPDGRQIEFRKYDFNRPDQISHWYILAVVPAKRWMNAINDANRVTLTPVSGDPRLRLTADFVDVDFDHFRVLATPVSKNSILEVRNVDVDSERGSIQVEALVGESSGRGPTQVVRYSFFQTTAPN